MKRGQQCNAKNGQPPRGGEKHCPVHGTAIRKAEELKNKFKGKDQSIVNQHIEEETKRLNKKEQYRAEIVNKTTPLDNKDINTLFAVGVTTGAQIVDPHFGAYKEEIGWHTLSDYVSYDHRELPVTIFTTEELGDVTIEASTYNDMLYNNEKADNYEDMQDKFYVVIGFTDPVTNEKRYFRRYGEDGSHGALSNLEDGPTEIVEPKKVKKVIYETEWI